MLGRRNPQASLFDGDRVYLDHVGRNTFYAFLAREGHDLFKDEDFGQLYHERLGRPSVPPSRLCVALVLQYYDGCSDQEASDRAAYDQRWKVALGAEEMERPFVKSTLQLFRAQLLVHEQARALFEASLELARRKGAMRRDGRVKLALDTTNILGRGAVMDTYNLISEGVRLLVKALARAQGQKPDEYARSQGLGRHFGSSIKGESQVDWDDDGARSVFLAGLVTDARRAMELAGRVCQRLEKESVAVRRIEAVSQMLAAILLQDVEVEQEGGDDEGAPAVERFKIKHNPSGQRICSVGDPEMRHGRKSASKRFDGHKLALGVDVESQLIAGVDVLEGSAADDEGSLELAQASAEALGVEPEEVEALADCAYGDGENRERFRRAGVELKAKVPAPSGSGGYFKKTDFVIDLEAMTCTCPGGQVTDVLRSMGQDSGRSRQSFVFAGTVCSGCPLRQSCFKPTQPRGRRVTLHPQEALLQEAREWRQSHDFDRFRKQRQAVEHRIARLMQLGMRQARYVGRRKTLFQALITATVANLTLIAGKMGAEAGPEHSNGHLTGSEAAVSTFADVIQALWTHISAPVAYRRHIRHRQAHTRPRPSLLITKAGFRPQL